MKRGTQFLSPGRGRAVVTVVAVFTLGLFLLAPPAAGQTPAWTARYSGPTGTDVVYPNHSMVVDSAGNVYVTGYSDSASNGSDYLTVKYNANGVEQWVARYNGPGNSSDEPYAIAVDGSGNVYVTGLSYGGSGSGYDYATIKYNSAGAQQWASRYTFSGNNTDHAYAIAADASGNVYVTGHSYSGSNYDYATLKYDSSGGQSWVQRYHNNTHDYGRAIQLDASGNVYVAGYSTSSSTTYDFAVVKYNNSGGQQWAARYNNSPTNGHEEVFQGGLAVDASGNVYVTGISDGGSSSYDYATVKYNSGGSQAWVARYNGPGNSSDYPYGGVKVDAGGNVYVTGSIHNGSNEDFGTIKYNSSGTQLWAARYDGLFGEDRAYGLAVDASGNVYITGHSVGLGEGNNYGTLKYDASGTLQWLAKYNGPNFGNDYGRAIALTTDGNVIVTGYDVGAGTGNDFLTIKYYQCNNLVADCNTNGVYDACDINAGTSEDCNTNGVPDECDTSGATSNDCDVNSVPDECDNQTGDVTWAGLNNASYSSSSNWTPAGPPRGQAQALLSNTGASDNRCILSAPGTTGVCLATVQASGAGKQTLQINDGSRYYSTNGTSILAGGEIDLRGGELSGGTVTNASNTLLGYGTVSANLINSGTVSVANLKDMDFTGASFDNQSGGSLYAAAGSRVLIASPDVSQSGDLEVRTTAIVSTSGALTNSAGGQITLYNGSLNAAGFTNALGADVSGFGTIDANTTNNGQMFTLADTQIVGDLTNNGTIVNMIGVLTVIGTFTNNGVFIGQPGGRSGSNGLAVTQDAEMGAAATLSLPGGTVKVNDDLDIAIDDPARFDLAAVQLQLSGLPLDGVQELEVLAADVGRRVTLPDAGLFSIGQMRIGPTATTVRLVNERRNSGDGREALYVDALTLDRGITLDLAGQALYYGRVSPADPRDPRFNITLTDSVGGGVFCQIGGTAGDGDLDGDCGVTTADLSMFVAVLLGLDTLPAHQMSSDLNLDGSANGADIRFFVERLLR